jgi:glycerol-3-phosphate acyltransferase PlsY
VVLVGIISSALLAYVLGSVPTGFLAGKAKGLDIRTVGSGNIGATNVFRYLGKPAGICVLLIDALKGLLAVVLAGKVLAPRFFQVTDPAVAEWFALVAAMFAVLGHNYTCWLRFKGGKGIATSAGVLVALVPWSLLVILTVWILVFAVSRFVSLASIAASFTLPFAAWATGESGTMIAITSVMTALAIYKHKSNIQRLLKGTEPRLALTKRQAAAAAQKHSS